ncbi:hypothetical protein J1605_003277 [Eschrichtius robustus]|uniref:Uncharacterized protein n=1 Tax=Eschrichtius robustus TaxID=9764 RepID=A0AB34HT52_ESCRO|nr:hypothetical protein J1605_003277 [Eschrichtius robustus]
MQTMLGNRRTAHQELCNHEDFLTKLCGELIKTIRDTEDSSALKVRLMLQQQDVFTTIADILEYSNKKKLHQMQCELQEWEEKEESKIHNLEQQVEQLDAKIEKVHKKVSFVSTYKDREYAIKSVQVANLVRQLQQVKDSQQDELDDLSEMCRMVLASMSNQIQNKKKNLLRSLVVKIQHAHQEALLQKTWNSRVILKYMDKFRELIDHFEEEIPILRAEMEQLQFQIWEPREIVFADILLRRSKYVILVFYVYLLLFLSLSFLLLYLLFFILLLFSLKSTVKFMMCLWSARHCECKQPLALPPWSQGGAQTLIGNEPPTNVPLQLTPELLKQRYGCGPGRA